LPGTAPAEPVIVRFRPGPPTCARAAEVPVVREEPFPTARYGLRPSDAQADGTMTLRFRIAADGRPLGIVEERAANMLPVNATDVAPAFSAWRFRPGSERGNCEIRFTVEARSVSETAPETLYRFLALHPISGQPLERAAGTAAIRRIRPDGSNCSEPRPNIRLQAYPSFELIPQARGTLSYSFLTYDIDADGEPENVHLVGSAGNAELDRQSLAAIARSRYQPGRRSGCVHYFYRSETAPTPAPAAPAEQAARLESATCPKDLPEWAFMPSLIFPPAFNRRGVEGWAMIRYDLAATGETRNIEIVSAEPAASFGEYALRIVRTARRQSADRDYVGCTERVIFQIPRTPREIKDGG
jgi:TonB family protein